MARFENYQSNAAEVPVMRKWVVKALVLSLLIHGGLYVFFRFQQIDNYTFTTPAEPAPLRFVVNQARIDPKLLEKPAKEPPKAPVLPADQKIVVPVDKPHPREIEFKPQTTDITSPLLADKPKAAPLNWDSLVKNDVDSAGRADKDLGGIASALLNSSVKAPNQPSVILPPGSKEGAGLGGNEGIPGRQSLDDALAKAGTPLGANQPVAMSGGALFEHNKTDLRSEALNDLKKIGQLVSHYPGATFLISGHTDWTGSAEYNQRLSEQRAEAVKAWLVSEMGIAEDRIQTVGKGSAEAIVAADRSVEEQQPNRRVEIVIKTHGK